MSTVYYCICGEDLDDACPEHGDDPASLILTCERCEITREDVAWCDHFSLCTECRAYFGCPHCRIDARIGW